MGTGSSLRSQLPRVEGVNWDLRSPGTSPPVAAVSWKACPSPNTEMVRRLGRLLLWKRKERQQIGGSGCLGGAQQALA